MPPPGGFEAVRYKRNLPIRGPGGYIVLAAVAAICGFGFYRVGLGNLERRSAGRSIVLCHLCVKQDPSAWLIGSSFPLQTASEMGRTLIHSFY